MYVFEITLFNIKIDKIKEHIKKQNIRSEYLSEYERAKKENNAYPLIKEGYIDGNTLIVDAKSGTSGAGRGAKQQNLYCEVNESIKAYGVTTHRHTPEIEEQLSYAPN